MQATHKQEEFVTVYEPENVLRNIIGNDVALKNVLTPEKIKACQKLIDDARMSFFKSARPDLEDLKSLVKERAVSFGRIALRAENIRGQARMFGFWFISNVCTHIADYCESTAHPAERRASVVARLVDALQVAFDNEISDEGGILNQHLSLTMGAEV